ncbi:hypothetical protein GGR57DRAFT_153932 [Xylariaceae sp. FL1272]|nr:hypothetical protein GGR57DRAFT_153932 [Xylariaceae sp. FL1272]
MAELALGVLGVALAWKGILDFGELILKLTDNDSRRREGLSIQLEVSQYMLRDWGEYWEIDRTEGKFHRFEPARKELIMKIISRLHESRMKAMQTLSNRYGISSPESDEKNVKVEKRLGRMVERAKTASKKVKDKGTWVIHDSAEITDLVNETKQLHESLQHLTHGSTRYIFEILSTDPCISPVPSRKNSLRIDTMSSHSNDIPCPEHDEQTLASEATMSIISAYQSGLIQDRIDSAFHFYGDDRIPGLLFQWWDDHRASLIVLETSDQPENVTGVATCALVYYLADCTKLIYAFDPNASIEPRSQLMDMLRTLLIRMVTLSNESQAGHISLPKYVTDIENGIMDDNTMQDLITHFCPALEVLALQSKSPLLLVLDGLEYIGASEACDLTNLTQILVSNLRSLCNKLGSKSMLKILLCCRGHALGLYSCIGDENIADITDYPLREVSLIQELATFL